MIEFVYLYIKMTFVDMKWTMQKLNYLYINVAFIL